MNRVIFRADGSLKLGLGHMMRCLAFADRLSQRDVPSLFVTRKFDSRVSDLIRSKQYEVQEIPPEISMKEEVSFVQKIANQNQARLIVTDLCHEIALENREKLDRYHRLLAIDCFTICLTGGSEVDFPVQVVVSPYFRTTYPPATQEGPILLLGPSYFIFRPEFVVASKAERKISKQAKNFFVMIGGSDEFHITSKIVKALCVLPQTDLSLQIAIGSLYTDLLKEEIKNLLTKFKGDSVLLDPDANMAKAMLWADLAITGDGLTKYETALTGTPSIILSRSSSEKLLNEEFKSANTALHLEDWTSISQSELAHKIDETAQNFSLRERMSERGKGLVDGKGVERIIAHLPEEVLQ